MFLKIAEILGDRCFEMHLGAGFGVEEAQGMGMQCGAFEGREYRRIDPFSLPGRGIAVELVPEERKSDGGEVCTDLVRVACRGGDFQKAIPLFLAEKAVLGSGGLSIYEVNNSAMAAISVDPQRRCNHTLLFL